jgi:urea transport system permease protein
MSFDILVMQVFSGLSLFTLLLLMGLGLAIVFGLMGVINMAHGELMTLGAYATYLTAQFFARHLPSLMGWYVRCNSVRVQCHVRLRLRA